MGLHMTPALRVLMNAIDLLDAGRPPTVAMVADQAGLPVAEVQDQVALLVEHGEVRTVEDRVVAVSDRMRQACGFWCGRTLGDGLKATLRGAIEDSVVERERTQFGAALQALEAVNPGVLEGLLGAFLARYDFVDTGALAALRATPSSTNTV
jgi:hypothetical protein